MIVPNKADANAVYGSLKTAQIAATILGPDERDKSDSKAVRIATMYRAKGLEFDEVVLLIPKNWGDLRTGRNSTQRLQYVAITRAKRRVTLMQY